MTDQAMSARWHVVEDPEAMHLHVTLWNGHTIAVTVWRDDAAAPFVALRAGDGEHDLAEVTAGMFKQWLAGAQGKPARQRTRQVAQQRTGRWRSSGDAEACAPRQDRARHTRAIPRRASRSWRSPPTN